MYYGAIKPCDIANGEGVRVSLFVSGCRHACKNCFNPETWCFEYGTPYTEETTAHILELLKPVYVKDIWCYTGCVLESELLSESPYRCDVTDALLSEIDVLVDGPFIEEEKSLQLAFRGSMNQRILRKQNGRFVVSET